MELFLLTGCWESKNIMWNWYHLWLNFEGKVLSMAVFQILFELIDFVLAQHNLLFLWGISYFFLPGLFFLSFVSGSEKSVSLNQYLIQQDLTKFLYYFLGYLQNFAYDFLQVFLFFSRRLSSRSFMTERSWRRQGTFMAR